MRSRMEQRAMSAPNPAAATAPRSYRRIHGNGSADQTETLPYRRSHSYDKQESPHAHTNSHAEEEGVEVVLDVSRNAPKVVESDGRDQHVFRGPHSQRHSNSMRNPGPVSSNTAYGGYGAPARGNYPQRRPPPIQAPYNKPRSFDHGEYPLPPKHYSPHVHYPTPGARGYGGEDVNVISPNHKPDTYMPPVTPRSRSDHPPGYYQYPPTSPVSRPGAAGNSPPRRHYGAMRRSEGPYSAAQRHGGPRPHHPEDGAFRRCAPTSNSRDGRPPLVAESSYDSDHYESAHSPYSSHPPTPSGALPGYDAHHSQGLYREGSWGSFDSANGVNGAPPHFDDHRYYGYPPESPYSSYAPSGAPYYGGQHHPPYNHPYDRHGYENEEDRLLNEYHEDPSLVTPHHVPRHHRDNESPSTQETQLISNKTCANGSLLPKAAAEIDFEVTAPPAKPICPPSDGPIYESHNNINSHDVLCGRGGGTNSQVGNRRFRKLVQEFQPTYLMARRKEKPLLARTIVLIIRKRGGHFLKKDEETGELYEVGDLKAEAKTSQALREGLDVRATRSAANGDKKGKKKKDGTSEISLADEDDVIKEEDENADDDDDARSPVVPAKVESNSPIMSRARTPPPRPEDARMSTPPASPTLTLPELAGEEGRNIAGIVHPHSPEIFGFRKRRRMRSREGCFPLEDKLFPDFCPPRADLGRTSSPTQDYMYPVGMPGCMPIRHRAYEQVPPEEVPQPGCAGIAMSIMTGAATGSFCLGPSNWSRK